MVRSAEDWLESLVRADRAPVLAKADQPDREVLRQLERRGALMRLPGEVVVLKRPTDPEAGVLRRVYWSIVEAVLANYHPAVVERDSAVRILVGDETPPEVLRIRNGRNASNFEIELPEDLQIVVASGIVEPSSITDEAVVDAVISLDEPARILIGLELRFVRDNIAMISLWLRSLVLSRASIEAAYHEHPRPVVLRRLAHMAEDVGNHRLAEMLTDVVRTNQEVRIGRGQTGVGRELVVPTYIRETATTRRPWLDRLHMQMESFGEQVREVIGQVEIEMTPRPIEPLLSQARGAKAHDIYHSTSIEGYRIRYEDVSVLLGGTPAGGSSEEEIRNRMAVLGYSLAFDNLLLRLEEEHERLRITDTLLLDLYVDLFQPSVEAGIVAAEVLRGWRNAPVFIRNSRYVPPAADRVGEMMNALITRLDLEESAVTKAVLAHLMLVTIHPFPDGNGRVARLLMNAILLSNGWPWLTIKEDERESYFATLRAAQVKEDSRPFAEFILQRELDVFGS